MATLHSIGERIRKLRRAKGLSQRGLVDELGYSNAYLSRIEAGDRTPSIKFLIAISERLGTTALYLYTGQHDAVCPMCLRKP